MKIYNVFFSPTGETKKVADIIVRGFSQERDYEKKRNAKNLGVSG